MALLHDWKELEVGKFYRLECGCRGQVAAKYVEPSPEGADTGFFMGYTVMGCINQTSHEKDYRAGYGPYTNFFNRDLCYQAMPAEEIEKPFWWDEVVGDKLLKRYAERGR